MSMYIMYGVADCNGEDELITAMLREKGCDVADYSARELKSGVLQFVEKHANEEEIVLILSQYLESHNPFTVDDFTIYQQYIPNVKIVLLMDIDRKGTQILQDMFNRGLYLATFVEDIDKDASLLYYLVTKGRTAVEARQYYGLQNTATTSVMRLTAQKALAHVTAPLGNGESYKDRVDFVKKHLQTEVEFMTLIDSLPNTIKNVLCEEPEYADYLAGYIAKMQRKNSGMEKEEERALLDRLEWGKKTLQMMSLGVAGASSRVGCTHQALMIANYLSSHGYRMAVVEVGGHVSPVFKKIANALNVDIKEGGYFSHDGVDYYPEFDLKNLPMLNTHQYNFLVLDFGVFSLGNKDELGRCSRRLIVTGSKKWETEALNVVYEAYKQPGQLGLCDFLFMSAPTSAKKAIMKGMAPLRRVYFADYEPNMFSRRGYHALHVLLRDYVETKGDEDVNGEGWLQRLVDKIRGFFE